MIPNGQSIMVAIMRKEARKLAESTGSEAKI